MHAFPLLVVLELDIALYPILFQVQQILLTAVAAVSSNCLQPVPKRFLMFFQKQGSAYCSRSGHC